MRTAGTAAKRERTLAKVTAQQPVDALLALDSGIRTFEINMDRFLQPFDGDPLQLETPFLQELVLLDIPAILFFSDREGSQSLGLDVDFVLGHCGS